MDDTRPVPHPMPRPGPRPRPVGPRPIMPNQPQPPRPEPTAVPGPAPEPPRQPTPAPAPPEPISPQPQRDVDPRKPRFVTYHIPVCTTDDVPGREVEAALGVVIGIATRPRDMAHHPEMGFINTAARQDAVGAMVQQAQEAGADAVVGVRFDNGKVSETVSELTAYGTAVRLRSVEGDQI